MKRPTRSTPASFVLDRVGVRYPMAAALSSVSVEIEPGSRVGLVGPSGAGKTTLLRVLNGTIRPTDGEVRVADQSIATLSPRELRRVRERIGFVHQDLNLIPNLRVLQNVTCGRLGRRGFWSSLRSVLLPRRDEAVEIHALLDRVGIGDKLYQRTDRLSGGEQQRVAIARALYQEPFAILADEPVASVDPARARDTVELLCELSAERGLTLCMSLHNLQLARRYFPRLIGLREGEVVFDGSPSSLTEAEFDELYELNGSSPDVHPGGTDSAIGAGSVEGR